MVPLTIFKIKKGGYFDFFNLKNFNGGSYLNTGNIPTFKLSIFFIIKWSISG